MLVKRYNMRGLNLRDSEINTPSEYSTDLQNVELDDRRRLVKRKGFDRYAGTFSIGLFEYVKRNELVEFRDDGINGVEYGCYPFVPSWTTCPDHAEYNGVMYFTDPDLNLNLYKYDGHSIYRAGLPKAIVESISTVGTSYWFRAHYTYVDGQRNIINGDYAEFGSSANTIDAEFNTLSDTDYKNRYGFISPLAPNQSLTKGNNYTLTMLAGHCIVEGDTMMIKVTNENDPLVYKLGLVQVISVSGNDININTDLFDDGDRVLNTITDGSLFSLAVKYFSSQDMTFGYAGTLTTYIIPLFQDNPTQTETLTYTNSAAVGFAPPFVFMEDEYDSTIIKGEPPKCKYITIYNNVMILANTSEEVARYQEKESSFFWSDTGIGSSVETFPPLNADTVGISSEGPINGIFALDDNIVVGKERQIYYVNGSLILQNYRIRSALSNGIGCISFRSMIEVDGGVLYMSQKGLYLAYSGRKPVEISQLIEPLFSDASLDLTKAESINDRVREKLYIHIPHTTDNIVLVYDYRYKEWFLHRGIDASGGFSMLINDMYHSDGSVIYIRNSSYSDNGSAIEAYYKTSWEHQGSPSLVKKWKKAVVISIGDFQWELNLKHQVDWVDQNVTDYRRLIGPVMVDDYSLNMSQKYAMRLDFGNDQLDQGMLITGYEYEFENTQERPKGDS